MDVKNIKYAPFGILCSILLLVSHTSHGQQNSVPEQQSVKPAFSYPSNIPKVKKLLNSYRKLGALSKLQGDAEHLAKNIMTWQMSHGGFGLHEATFYNKPWDGHKKRSHWVSKNRELGNFDDDATVAELRFLADVYHKTSDSQLKTSIKASIAQGLKFIFKSQYANGGWPQVYPKRYKPDYSNHVTLNDNAMIRTMVLLSDMLANVEPFNADVVPNNLKNEIYLRLESAVNYLLKAQIKSNGALSIWSSQYDYKTGEPASARSFELASKSGRESVGVLVYLMNWPEKSEEVVTAITSGINWYNANKVKNLTLKKGVFSHQEGAELWYRFYELDSNVPFFAGRDGVKKFDLSLIEEERRTGYSWGRNYATKMLRAAPLYLNALENK